MSYRRLPVTLKLIGFRWGEIKVGVGVQSDSSDVSDWSDDVGQQGLRSIFSQAEYSTEELGRQGQSLGTIGAGNEAGKRQIT
jgi:hypothetical protein